MEIQQPKAYAPVQNGESRDQASSISGAAQEAYGVWEGQLLARRADLQRERQSLSMRIGEIDQALAVVRNEPVIQKLQRVLDLINS